MINEILKLNNLELIIDYWWLLIIGIIIVIILIKAAIKEILRLIIEGISSAILMVFGVILMIIGTVLKIIFTPLKWLISKKDKNNKYDDWDD